MITTRQSLISAICRFPDEDGYRLHFASWLDQHGERERAEFIRTQIELGRTDYFSPQWTALTARKNELLERYGDVWAAEVPVPGATWFRFRRGLVEEVQTSAHAFYRQEMLHFNLPLRAAHLTKASGQVANLHQALNFDLLSTLAINDGKFGDADLATLATTGAGRFTSLSVTGARWDGTTKIGDAGFTALAAAPFFPRLTSLWLSANRTLGSSGLKALARSGAARALQRLHLFWTDVCDIGASALANGGFESLAVLTVYGSRITNAGLNALITSTRLPNLIHLGLYHSRVMPAGVAALARASSAGRLRSVEVEGSRTRSITGADLAPVRDAHPALAVSTSTHTLLRALRSGHPDAFAPCAFTDAQGDPSLDLPHDAFDVFETSSFEDAHGTLRDGPRVAG